MLEEIRRRIRERLDARAQQQERLDGVLATAEQEQRSELTEDEATVLAEVRGAIEFVDAEIEQLQAREAELADLAERRQRAESVAGQYAQGSGGQSAGEGRSTETSLRVGREPTTYQRGGDNSYVRDLVLARRPDGADQRAVERLQRHRQEMEVEERALSTAAGEGGEFVPPRWLVDQFVPVARAGRVTAELCRGLPLPGGTDSINIPRMATGTAVAEQTEGTSVQETDATTDSVDAAVRTMAGQQLLTMQQVDQSPVNFDEIVMQDLIADHANKVGTYVLTRSGTGILEVSGVNEVTWTEGSPTLALLYPKGADAMQRVQTSVFRSPQAWVMHPRRWAWMLAELDSQNRPLIVPNTQGPTNAFAGITNVRAEGSVGTWHGLPVFLDPNVPTNLGDGDDEDVIIGAVFDDLFLYESSLRTRVLFETDADELKVRLQVWSYIAFLGDRRPAAISKIEGTGLVAPTF